MALFQVIRGFMKNVITNSNHIETQTGRWCIPDSPKYFTKATLIMDRSNEDHCGTCGDNMLLNKSVSIEIDKLIDEDIYYYPYTM